MLNHLPVPFQNNAECSFQKVGYYVTLLLQQRNKSSDISFAEGRWRRCRAASRHCSCRRRFSSLHAGSRPHSLCPALLSSLFLPSSQLKHTSFVSWMLQCILPVCPPSLPKQKGGDAEERYIYDITPSLILF